MLETMGNTRSRCVRNERFRTDRHKWIITVDILKSFTAVV